MNKKSKSWISLQAYFPRGAGKLQATCYRLGQMGFDRRTKSGQLVAGFNLARTEVLEWTKHPEGMYWVMLFWPHVWGEMGATVPNLWSRWGSDRHYQFERVLTRGLLKTYLPWLRNMFKTLSSQPLKS